MAAAAAAVACRWVFVVLQVIIPLHMLLVVTSGTSNSLLFGQEFPIIREILMFYKDCSVKSYSFEKTKMKYASLWGCFCGPNQTTSLLIIINPGKCITLFETRKRSLHLTNVNYMWMYVIASIKILWLANTQKTNNKKHISRQMFRQFSAF